MSKFAAIASAYSGLNSLTGGALNKFIVKNAGKLAGHGLNAVGSGIDWIGSKFGKKWNVKQKMGNAATKVADIATTIAGDKNEKVKQIADAAKVMRGENVAFKSIGDNKPAVSAPAVSLPALADPNQQTALIPYVRNVGGSNYHKAGSSSLGRNKRRHRRF